MRRLFLRRFFIAVLFLHPSQFLHYTFTETPSASPPDVVSFSARADHSHPAAVHFHHQAGTFQLSSCAGRGF
jgi:hypothetical protein